MKQLILLFVTALAVLVYKPTAAQAVLNEIYSDPSTGNHEFFELYNTSISGTPISMDNYSIVTYYESVTERGFYVLDLPNLPVGPKGYFVGAAQMPFSYQGTQNSDKANFSWNDPLLADKHGYLKKYILTGPASTPDSLKTYTVAPAPADLNNLFFKRNGNGAAYSTFVYQNGKLVNAFFGGTGGTAAVPQHIINLPKLTVDVVTADSNKAFTINFNNFSNTPIEGVTETTGSDNGFIRTRDGLCNYWGKSSANVYHTPGASNGGAAGIQGALTLTNHIYIGNAPTDSSFLNYNITAGPTSLFPVTLQLYLDNGVTEGQLDSADVFVGQNIETVLSDGAFTTKYMPHLQDLLLIAETSIGCLDQVVYIAPPEQVGYTVLPVKITHFKASPKAQHHQVEWHVEGNEGVKSFEVEKSSDGLLFRKVGALNSNGNKGATAYTYAAPKEGNEKTFYRLKMLNSNGTTSYSEIVMTTAATIDGANLQVLQNPVRNQLLLQYTAEQDEEQQVTIYNMAGVMVLRKKIQMHKGINQTSIAVDALSKGTYVVQMAGLQKTSINKFIKQ